MDTLLQLIVLGVVALLIGSETVGRSDDDTTTVAPRTHPFKVLF